MQRKYTYTLAHAHTNRDDQQTKQQKTRLNGWEERKLNEYMRI